MRYPMRGVTLIELVIVVVVIAILSVSAVFSFGSMTQHSVNTQADEFRRNLSHIQLLAISQGNRLRLSVNADGSNYTVVTCNTSECDAPTTLIDPATGLNFSVALINGVTLAPINDVLDFDSLGRPRKQSDGSLITNIPARSYTLTGGGHSVRVCVAPITGFAWTKYDNSLCTS